MDLDPLAATVREIAGGREHVARLLDQRDRQIRAALAAGVAYRDIADVTGLHRATLDHIRLGGHEPR